MRTEGLVDEVAAEQEATPLPITIALAVWFVATLVLVGASVLGGAPHNG